MKLGQETGFKKCNLILSIPFSPVRKYSEISFLAQFCELFRLENAHMSE